MGKRMIRLTEEQFKEIIANATKILVRESMGINDPDDGVEIPKWEQDMYNPDVISAMKNSMSFRNDQIGIPTGWKKKYLQAIRDRENSIKHSGDDALRSRSSQSMDDAMRELKKEHPNTKDRKRAYNNFGKFIDKMRGYTPQIYDDVPDYEFGNGVEDDDDYDD